MLKFSLKLNLFLLCVISVIFASLIYKDMLPKYGKSIFPKDELRQFFVDDTHFVKKDGVWVLKNLNDYYADIAFVKSMLYVFENAKYGHKTSQNPKELFEVKLNDKKYFIDGHIIKINKDENREMSVGLKLYKKDYQYMMNPIWIFNYEDVTTFEEDGIKHLYKDRDLIKDIQYMRVAEAKKNMEDKPIKHIKLEFNSGLLMHVTYYPQNWVSLKYEKKSVMFGNVFKKIEHYNLITSGWYFKFI